MKTELRIQDHALLPDAKVIELWHDGVFIGTVTGADGPGVRIVSKYLTNSVHGVMFIVLEPVPVLQVTLQP